jgi:hypothetical protein
MRGELHGEQCTGRPPLSRSGPRVRTS